MDHLSPITIGELVKQTRKKLKLTRSTLALTSGTGLRFITDLERGKPTCQLGKALLVLRTLGIRVTFTGPDESIKGLPGSQADETGDRNK